MNQFQGPKTYENFTIPNAVISSHNLQSQSVNLNTTATAFIPSSKPFVPTRKAAPGSTAAPIASASADKDPLVYKLEGLRLSDEEVSKVKELITKVKSEGKLTLELITQFKTLAICQHKPKFYWEDQTKREPELRILEKTQFTKGGGGRGNYPQRGGRGGGGRGGYQDRPGAGGSNEFGKGQIKQHHQREEVVPLDPFKRAEADQLRKKLAEESKKVLEKAKGDKNVQQQIRLIVNVITPDNLDKKFEELRRIIFGDLRHIKEEGYDANTQTELTDEMLNDENLNIVVETIFRKAQNEKEYCNFYGDLCEKMIRLELNLRGQEAKTSTIKNSVFRKTLLEHCKKSFN